MDSNSGITYSYLVDKFLEDQSTREELLESFAMNDIDMSNAHIEAVLDFAAKFPDKRIARALFIPGNYRALKNNHLTSEQLSFLSSKVSHYFERYVQGSPFFESIQTLAVNIKPYNFDWNEGRYWMMDFLINSLDFVYEEGLLNDTTLDNVLRLAANSWIFGLSTTLDAEEMNFDLDRHWYLSNNRDESYIGFFEISHRMLWGYVSDPPSNVSYDQFSSSVALEQSQRLELAIDKMLDIPVIFDKSEYSPKVELYSVFMKTLRRIIEFEDSNLTELYLNTLNELLEAKANIGFINTFNASFYEIARKAEHTAKKNPFELFCRDTLQIFRYAPKQFNEAVKLLEEIYILGYKKSDIATVAISNLSREEARLEKECIETFLARYIKEDIQHREKFKAALPFVHMDSPKYWYTDIATSVVMQALDYTDTACCQETLKTYFGSEGFAMMRSEKRSIVYNDGGAFMGDKSSAALEELFSVAETQELSKIYMRIIESSPGLMEIAHTRLIDTYERLSERSKERWMRQIKVDIQKVPGGDLEDLGHIPHIQSPDVLNIWAFQNVLKNYSLPDAKELLKALPVKDRFILVIEEDFEKDITDYKSQSIIGEKMFERMGCTEGDLHKWGYEQRFDMVLQGYEFYIDEQGNRKLSGFKEGQTGYKDIIKAVRTERDFTPKYMGKDAYYRLHENDVEVQFWDGVGSSPLESGFAKVVIPKDTVIQTMLSRASTPEALDHFYLHEAFPGLEANLASTSADGRMRIYEYTAKV